MAISKLPDDQPKAEKHLPSVSEKKIQAFINKGGKPTGRVGDAVNPDDIKGIKINFKASEIDAIKTLRNKRPCSRSRKIPISIHDWVIEAVQEKIQREQKKYGLTLM